MPKLGHFADDGEIAMARPVGELDQAGFVFTCSRGIDRGDGRRADAAAFIADPL